MTRLFKFALAAPFATLLFAQQFKFNFDHLEAKAKAIDVSLNGSMLKFAARFLDNSDPDEAKVKKLLGGIEGVYVKHFEFKRPGEWTQADVDSVRVQLKTPEWSRIVGYKNGDDGENAEIWIRSENNKFNGLAILATQPKELTVVNIVGAIDLDSLADLGGHFGVPKLEKKK
jgi:hypothetical protein